jgi:hypothetical protein
MGCASPKLPTILNPFPVTISKAGAQDAIHFTRHFKILVVDWVCSLKGLPGALLIDSHGKGTFVVDACGSRDDWSFWIRTSSLASIKSHQSHPTLHLFHFLDWAAWSAEALSSPFFVLSERNRAG